MSFLIPFNNSKVVANGFNNTYVHNFSGSSVNLKDAEIAIHSISMFNSVFNIDSATFGNNTVSVKMPTAATTSTISITFPDGIYNYADLTRYIQSQLAAAGAYLIDADGNNVHYIQITENATYYSAQLDCSPLPTSLPVGYSLPATGLYSGAGTGLPTTTRVPILNVSNSTFGSIIGFSVAEYPSTAQTTLQTFLSNITPQVHPISSYLVRCNLITNPYVMPSDILGSFDTQGTTAGQLISYKPNEYCWVPVADGSYASIKLTIVAQNESFVRIKDGNLNMVIAIRSKSK